jgi:hypothetical protein
VTLSYTSFLRQVEQGNIIDVTARGLTIQGTLTYAMLREGWGRPNRNWTAKRALVMAAHAHHREANPLRVARDRKATAIRLTQPKVATVR